MPNLEGDLRHCYLTTWGLLGKRRARPGHNIEDRDSPCYLTRRGRKGMMRAWPGQHISRCYLTRRGHRGMRRARSRHNINDRDSRFGQAILRSSLCRRSRTLSIAGFRCRHFPTWLDDVCLFNLAKIELQFLECEHLPTLGQLPSLTYIKIMQIGGLKSVGSEFCRKDASARGYQALMQLEFSNMLEWAEWFGVEDGEFCSLQTLNISSCHKLKTVPSVLSSSLASLEIIYCESLLKLPTLPSLDILHLHQCGNLTELPALPKLTELYLKFCRKLFVISLLPSLRALEITECPRLTILPAMPLLVKIKCVGCSDLQVISSLPSLKELHIIDCPILTTLCNMPSLIEMNCDGCSGLCAISVPSLQQLDIHDCPSLTKLQCLPSLTELSCVTCRNLSMITPLPSLKDLVISGCPSLEALPQMPSLTSLRCARCPGLNVVSPPPSLAELHVTDCPNVKTLPHLPLLTTMRLEGEFCDEFFSGLLNFHHTLLEEIFIFSDSVKCFPLSQHNLPSLAYLALGCANMVGELAGFESLRVLEILNCPKLCVHEVLKAQLQILEIHDKAEEGSFSAMRFVSTGDPGSNKKWSWLNLLSRSKYHNIFSFDRELGALSEAVEVCQD